MTASKWWWIGAFVVVDLVLLMVVRAHLSTDDAPPPTALPVTDPASPAGAAVPLLATAAGNVTVWSVRGDCRDGADVPISRLDADELTSLSPGVAEVLRLDLTGGGDLYVVGADADCQVVERVLERGSDTWRDAVGDIVLWHLAAEAGPAVVTPAATADPGSAVVALTQDGDTGRAACADGSMRVSDDEGRSWREIGRLEGLLAATADDDALGLSGGEGCTVAAFRSTDGGGAWAQVGCVADDPGPAVAIASGAATVAVLGDRVLRSTDDGATWEPVAVTTP